MYTFNKQVGCHHGLFTEVVDDSGIVTHTEDGGCVLYFYIFGKVVYESEFAVVRYFCSLFHAVKLSYHRIWAKHSEKSLT
jgi:hypothetical protein